MPSRFRRITRQLFRWSCRLLVFLILFVLVAAIYLERAGLPQFAKDKLVAAVRARGWEMEFSSLRFHWYRGIVAEHLQLQRTRQRPGPQIFVEEASCHLNRRALRDFQVEVDSVFLRGGRVVWPFIETNQHTATFRLDRIGGELAFKTNDVWELRSLNTELLGTEIQISGLLTNASMVRDWRFRKGTNESAEATQALWRRIVSTAERVKFYGEPRLITRIDGDARDFRKTDADLRFVVPAVDSPWGRGTNILLHARVLPARDRNETLQTDFELIAEDSTTLWGRARKLRINWDFEPPMAGVVPTNAHFVLDLLYPETPWARGRHAIATVHHSPVSTNSTFSRADVQASVEDFQSPWASSPYAQINTAITHSGTNVLPISFSAELRLKQPSTEWGNAEGANVLVTCKLPAREQFALLNTNLVWVQRLSNTTFTASVSASNVLSHDLHGEQVNINADWDSRVLSLRSVASLYGGHLMAKASVDSITRQTEFHAESDFEPKHIVPLLQPKTQRWISNYSWTTAPLLRVDGRVTFPEWSRQSS